MNKIACIVALALLLVATEARVGLLPTLYNLNVADALVSASTGASNVDDSSGPSAAPHSPALLEVVRRAAR